MSNLDVYFLNDEQLFNFLHDITTDRAIVNFTALITWGANVQTCTISIEDDAYCSMGTQLSTQDVQDSISNFPIEDIPFEEPGLYSFTCLVKIDYRSWVLLEFLHSEVYFVISTEKMSSQNDNSQDDNINFGDTFIF